MTNKERTKEDIASFYDDFSEVYDYQRKQQYFSFITDLETELIREFINCGDALEIGCGTGLILEKTTRMAKKAYGIDLSSQMLSVAKNKGLTVLRGDATALPFNDQSYDLVYSFKVLAHVPRIKETVIEIKRVCKQEGVIILEFYNPFSIKFIVNKISSLFSRDSVYIRYDSYRKIKEYLGDDVNIIRLRGIRIITPMAVMLKIPVFANLLNFVERKLSYSPLKYLGSYLAVVAKKKY